MKTLVINGSPKGQNSNTYKLTRAFLEGAGYQDAEVIDVFSTDIRPCRGCFACWNKTPGKCVIKDAMAGILDKIIAADAVIWSFPLYYFSVPGPLKNLLDRLLPLCLPFMSSDNESGGHFGRYDLSGQRCAVISTCGFWTAKGNYGGVEAIFDRLYGDDYAKIFCGQGELFRVPELSQHTGAYLGVVAQAGAEFAASGKIDVQTRERLETPLFPRAAYETMADASWGIDNMAAAPADQSLAYTKQMAALYKPDGHQRVLEIEYTDIGKSYQLLLTDSGAQVISDGFKPYTTKIETPFDVWKRIGAGELSGQQALFKKMFRVLGDFDVMLNWDKLFGAGAGGKSTIRGEQQKKTNMLALLIPWIVLWSAIPIDAKWGSIISIMVAGFIPLFWLLCKPVLYERITVPAVAALSLWALLGGDTRVIMPLSYALFGAMWFITVFFKTPLTAYYSANDYGLEAAFQNPLFMRTNRILTGAWGVLYLITAIWTYALMRTPLSPYTGLINCAAPALMGAFTAWFQKWYPAAYAKSIRN